MASPVPPRRLPRARHEYLLRELELRGSVRASVIADDLGVAEVTIRRDIITLERSGALARVHGGAISVGTTTKPRPARALIGLVLPGSGSHFPDVVRGAEMASQGLRARVILASSNYRATVEQRQVERLVSLGAEGLILTPSLRDQSIDDVAAYLAELSVPLVLVERRLDESNQLAPYDWIRTDHVRGTILALEHLTGLGHRRIGLALLDRTPTAPSIREGYARGRTELALEDAPQHSLPKDDGSESDPVDHALETFLEECLSRGVRAALLHTDFYAARLVEIALDHGVRVPEDIAIVAYDDEFAELGIVPLTAVSPPGREIGRLAMQTIFERIRTQEEASAPRHIHLVPRLTIRRSCGAQA
ncbi:substrate-binding domain-containing protein [Ruania suaedae]|uniref:substrate-binding domain-containing protein n=1 Tax=Ruania suaedae TaxID=2897774 RepID=UPI001E5EB8A9|nr:substrate-binding domain-containing protein [Ruania suaedae]UFU03921.1 substrate-binding domain-containing protein [Ruania suaedae]